MWTTPSFGLLTALTFFTPSDSTWVLGVRKWILSTMTQITTTMVTSTMPKSRNLRGTCSLELPGVVGRGRTVWAWRRAWRGRGVGGAGRAVTHLPMRGMARDVAGSLLEMSSRKTDCARSTEMAIDVFSPPGGVWT